MNPDDPQAPDARGGPEDTAAARALRLVRPSLQPQAPAVTSKRVAANVPPVAWVYVGVVCAAAGVVLLRAIVDIGPVPAAAMSLLMLLSLLASTIKIEIPVFGNASTLTACHVIDLMALVMYGPHAGVLVAAWGGWTQCTFRTRVRNPAHQTAFSVASLAITMSAAGAIFTGMGGHAVGTTESLRWEPFAAAAAAFFVLNTGLVAGVVALTTARRLSRIWFDFFFSSWPSYVIGAVLVAAIVSGMQHRSYWLAPMLVTALILMHRNHKIVVERMNDALIDPVTGLPNQRSIAAHAAHELAVAERSGTRVAIAVIDLDNFKRINDRVGHATGDLVLKRVADVLRHAVRGGDLCARYGGDEFVLVMSGCGAADARRRLDEARKVVAETTFDGQAVVGTPLRISAGVAAFPEDGDRFSALFAVADARMYACKHGRQTPWSRNA